MNTAELLVRCLENEGVKVVFGIPGEENLAMMNALARSSIRFITVRHEQGAAFMADAYGRLTGVTEEDPAPALTRLCQRFGLPVSTDIPPSAMAEHMLIDKKADGSRIRLILLKNLGEACVETVTKEELIQRMQQLDAVWGK